jgi:hypothetical protein
MFNILQLFLAISNDPHSMLLTSAHYCSHKHLNYVTLNWRCALNVCGSIKHLNTKTKLYHKITFLLYTWHHEYAVVIVQMNVSHTDTTLWIFYTTCGSYKDKQYLLPCGEKKTTHPAKEQRYRLDNYTQNATWNLPFSWKIYLTLLCHKNQKQITTKMK